MRHLVSIKTSLNIPKETNLRSAQGDVENMGENREPTKRSYIPVPTHSEGAHPFFEGTAIGQGNQREATCGPAGDRRKPKPDSPAELPVAGTCPSAGRTCKHAQSTLSLRFFKQQKLGSSHGASKFGAPFGISFQRKHKAAPESEKEPYC